DNKVRHCNFASKREQRPLAGSAEQEQSQALEEGLKVNFAIERGQRPLAGYAEQEQMMVQAERRAKHCLSYAEVPPIQAAGKSSPAGGLSME
ncbi:MAG: hypothetical protein K2I13_07540, partial [Alistipes sp.]|nr:hypothetical protein [Alistipes sp.]